MEGIPHSYLIYIIHYVLVVKQATLQPDVSVFKGKQSASASWDLYLENNAVAQMLRWSSRTLLEGSSLGFPRGTSTPSSVVLDSAKSGIIRPNPFVPQQVKQPYVFTYQAAKTIFSSKDFDSSVVYHAVLKQSRREQLMFFQLNWPQHQENWSQEIYIQDDEGKKTSKRYSINNQP
jgi:hypothetical protein